MLLRLYRVCLICVRALLSIGSLADLLICALFNYWLIWLSALLLTCLLVHVLICIKRAQEAQVQILVKLCTQALQDLTTDVPQKPRCRFWSNCVLKFYRICPQTCPGSPAADFGQIVYSSSTGFDHRRAQEAQVQILVKLCTQVLQDVIRDVPRKPRFQILARLYTQVLSIQFDHKRAQEAQVQILV